MLYLDYMKQQFNAAPKGPEQIYYTAREVGLLFGKGRNSGYRLISSLGLAKYDINGITHVRIDDLQAAIESTHERHAA
jgi:hypothetical protein